MRYAGGREAGGDVLSVGKGIGADGGSARATGSDDGFGGTGGGAD